MSDNLARKLDDQKSSRPRQKPGDNIIPFIKNAPTQELALKRQIYQKQRQKELAAAEAENEENYWPDWPEATESEAEMPTETESDEESQKSKKTNNKNEKDQDKDNKDDKNKEKNSAENKKDEKPAEKEQEQKGGGKQKEDAGIKQEPIKTPEKEKKEADKNQPTPEQEMDRAKTSSRLAQVAKAAEVAKKLKEGDLAGAAEEVAGAVAQEGSKKFLNTLWASVWLDYTLLSLLGLNAYLFSSLLLPNWVAPFGSDDVLGTWLGGGRIGFNSEFAKIIEIIILVVIDIIVLAILLFIFYVIYQMVTGSWLGMGWDWLTGGMSKVITNRLTPS